MVILILEQFLDDLEEETCCWVRRHQPQDMEQDLLLAESFSAAQKVVPRGRQPKSVGIGKRSESCWNVPWVAKLPTKWGVMFQVWRRGTYWLTVFQAASQTNTMDTRT